MRPLLWLIAALLFLGSVALALFLLRGRPTSIPAPKLGLSDLVNVALLAVTIGTLYVAVATYVDAKMSSEEQQKSLDASRKALDSVVETAQGQQALLKQNLETSNTQLALIQQQVKAEQERAARRAQLEFVSLGGTPWNQIEQANGNIQIPVPPAGWIRLDLVLRNIGNTSLVHPICVFSASQETVFIDQADFRIAERPRHNILQLSGTQITDILPRSLTGTDFQVSVDVTVPNTVANFDFAFKAVGENMDNAKTYTLHITAIHQQ